MDVVWDVLLYGLMAAVTLVLLFGIYTLFRGGDFSRSWSNKAMRARVLLQFLAVVVLVAAAWFRSRGA